MRKTEIHSGMTRRNFAQTVSLFLGVLFLVSFTENATAQKPDFTGSWTFSQEKSDQPQGGGRGFGSGTLNIKQDGNNLSVERTVNRDGEEMTFSSKYTLDGNESENTMGNMGGTSKSVAKWSDDKKSLNIATTSTRERDGEMVEFKSNEVWTLSDGGKTLTNISTRTNRDGVLRTTKRVYDKK